MKTLKEYAEFLYKNGYKESFAPYTFLCDKLEIVEFTKNDFRLNLYVYETEEFEKFYESLKDGEEYSIDYKNYIVSSAFIEFPICNVPNFFDGTTEGITLVSKPDEYNKHTLDLFELCIGFQKINLLEHELFIMSKRQEQLKWAKDNLIPILEKCDFYITYNSFFDTKNERGSSNDRIDFRHPNKADFVLETDCLTGEPNIWADIITGNGTINLNKIYGKNKDEVFNILLEEVFKKSELKFGYLYNNDPKETIETYGEVLTLMEAVNRKEKAQINFDIIPDRYKKFVEDYNKLFSEND